MNIKSMLITTLVILGCASPILLAHVVWRFEPILSLNLQVVDYSVPKENYWNHKGLFWLLNHLRITEPKHGGIWEVERDYIGYDPKGEGKSQRISEADLTDTNWLYLSDTYGVHVQDRAPSPKDTVEKGFIFGGLSNEDAFTLQQFVDSGGNIISEFNTLADPTPKQARQIVSNIMDIEWLGWSGRFIVDFANMTPHYPWFESLYRANYGNAPIPKGPGMMLIHESGKLVVLSDAPFEQSMPALVLTEIGKEWIKAPIGTPPYYGWFAIIDTGNDTDVLAEIVMPTPNDWEERFRPKGVPKKFPLITRKQKNNSMRIYMAANLSVVDEIPTFHSLAFLPSILATTHRRRDSQHHGPTYWQFFIPVVGRLLIDAAEQSQKEQIR